MSAFHLPRRALIAAPFLASFLLGLACSDDEGKDLFGGSGGTPASPATTSSTEPPPPAGCTLDGECAAMAPRVYCDPATAACVECLDASYCASGACSSGVCTEGCVPKNCAELGLDCGDVDNGCGKLIACGGCGAAEACVDNRCSCTSPGTCETISTELGIASPCGTFDDGCGGVFECGACSSFCGSTGVCDCEPTSCEAMGRDCGSAPDSCVPGGSLYCGRCAPGFDCVDNSCAPR